MRCLPILLLLVALCGVCAAPLASAAPAGIAVPEVVDERLRLDLFAREPDVVTPIGIDVDAAGRVFVIESHTHFPKPDYPGHATDRVLVLEDLDGDASADRFTVFASGFTHAMALKLLGPRELLLATRREVLVLRDGDEDGVAEARQTVARLETKGDYPHNGLSGFALDDFGRVYFGLGENLGAEYCLAGADGRRLCGGGEGGNVYRMRRDGSALEIWATGFWNPFHVAFDGFGNLFAVDNDPDSRPPCRLLHVVRGGDYGYRFRLGRKGLHPFSSWNGELAGTLPMTSGTGEAPSGILVCEHESLPAEYHGALLVTSWGDYRLEVHRLRPHGASFRSDPKVLVRGGEAFRPVGIAAGPDGAVYFTDWVDRDYHVHRKGRVWRLRAKGPAAAPLDLSGGYSAPSADTGGFAGEAERWRRGRARHRQLVTAATAGRLGLEAIEHIGDAELRAAAVRLLANESAPSPQAVEVITRLACEDPSPRVRLEALLGVRGPPAIEKLAATFHAEEDPFLQAAALDAAARLSTKASIQALASSPEPRVRLFALLVLRRNGGVGREVAPFAAAGERLAPDAAAPFLRDRDPDVRRAALQWVGEERLVELSEAVDEALCAGPIDRALLDAYLAALGMLRGERPEGRDARSRDEFLHDLACEKGRPAALRALALRSVSTSFRGWKLERLRDLLSEADLDLRREALRSLSQTGLGGARGLLVEVARRPAEDRRLRREAVASLAAFVADRSDDLAAPLAALLEDADASVRREAARSLRGVPLAEDLDARRARIEAEVRERGPSAALPSGSSGWREGLLSGGDPLEGELVFFHPRGPRCSSCHTVRGRGGLAGPDLSAAGAATRERLLDSLLVPSKEIAPRFVTRTVVTATGIHTGVLLGEDPEGRILLANAQGEVLSIPRRDAVEVREEAASLMPENLAAQLEYGELRDLLSYLESLK